MLDAFCCGLALDFSFDLDSWYMCLKAKCQLLTASCMLSRRHKLRFGMKKSGCARRYRQSLVWLPLSIINTC